MYPLHPGRSYFARIMTSFSLSLTFVSFDFNLKNTERKKGSHLHHHRWKCDPFGLFYLLILQGFFITTIIVIMIIMTCEDTWQNSPCSVRGKDSWAGVVAKWPGCVALAHRTSVPSSQLLPWGNARSGGVHIVVVQDRLDSPREFGRLWGNPTLLDWRDEPQRVQQIFLVMTSFVSHHAPIVGVEGSHDVW